MCVGLTGVPPAGVSVRLVYELHVIGFASPPSALGLDEFRVATSAAQPSPSGTTCVLLPLPSGGLTGFAVASIVHTAANVRPIGLWLVGVDASGTTYCTRESAPTNAAHPPFAVSVLAAYQVVDSFRQNFGAVQQNLQAALPFGAYRRTQARPGQSCHWAPQALSARTWPLAPATTGSTQPVRSSSHTAMWTRRVCGRSLPKRCAALRTLLGPVR